MDINKFMDLVELTRKTTGTDWIYNRRVLRLKLRYLIECEAKKLHKHGVSFSDEGAEVCDHEFHHVHTNWYRCIKCGYVTSW